MKAQFTSSFLATVLVVSTCLLPQMVYARCEIHGGNRKPGCPTCGYTSGAGSSGSGSYGGGGTSSNWQQQQQAEQERQRQAWQQSQENQRREQERRQQQLQQQQRAIQSLSQTFADSFRELTRPKPIEIHDDEEEDYSSESRDQTGTTYGPTTSSRTYLPPATTTDSTYNPSYIPPSQPAPPRPVLDTPLSSFVSSSSRAQTAGSTTTAASLSEFLNPASGRAKVEIANGSSTGSLMALLNSNPPPARSTQPPPSAKPAGNVSALLDDLIAPKGTAPTNSVSK